jgi:hypothetical protein
VIAALARMGEWAHAQDQNIELLLLGGSLMVLVFETRQATRDMEVVILSPAETAGVRAMANTVGHARRLRRELPGAYNGVWQSVQPFLQPGRELKAKLAFDDLWEESHGSGGTTG